MKPPSLRPSLYRLSIFLKPAWPPAWLAALLLLLPGPAAQAAPDNLQIALAPPGVVLTWNSTNSVLESAFNLTGPWKTMTSGTTTYSLVPMASQEFYRLLILSWTGTNLLPVAVNDFYAMEHDTFLSVLPEGVLTDATAVDSNLLTAALYSPPLNGTVDLSADGSFVYTPNSGFVGTDTFQYVALDGLLTSSAATVSITVTDSPPVVVNDQFGIEMNTTGGAAAPGVLRNATYLAGDVLSVTLENTTTNGVLALHTDGSFEYTPNNGFVGSDTFTYVASSTTSTSGVAVVTLVVHGSYLTPLANPTNYFMAHDQTLSVGAPGLLNLASDPDLDPLTAAVVTAPVNGTLTLMPDGSFNYEPTNGFTGTDSFTWEAQDGTTNSTPATVTITVTNGTPVAVAETYYVEPGGTLTNLAPGVLARDTDPDGDSLTAVLVTPPVSGVLTLSTNGGFVYQPAPSFTGTDTFTYAASDGISTSAAALVSIVVTNRPPTTQPDSYGLVMNETLVVTPPGVLGNDTDPSANPLSASLLTGPLHGTLTFATNGGFVYIPAGGYAGSDTFTYAASDGYATSDPVTVTLNIVTNDIAPLAVPDFYTIRPGETLSPDIYTGVLVNDVDVDNCYLTAALMHNVIHGSLALNSDGSFVYQPTNGFLGMDSFTYIASNGFSNSAPATVSITVTDAAPVSVADAYGIHSTNVLTIYAPGVLDNDYDPDDGDTITATLVSGPAHGTLSLDPSGEFTYQATNGFLGMDTFTYVASDGILTGAVTQVSISVTNGVPVAGNDQESTAMNTTLSMTAPGVLAFCYDPDDDPLTVIMVSPPSNAASFILNPDGSYTYTPAPGFIGTDTFSYVAFDGIAAGAPAQVTITVTPPGGPVGPKKPLPALPTELDLLAISFSGGTPVASDTARPLIGGPPQWLDNGDGIINFFAGEHSYPYSYVRGSYMFARVAFHTPNRNAFRGPNGQYVPLGLRGLIVANGAFLPNQIAAPIRYFGIAPDRIGTGGTIYVDMVSAVPFTSVVGVVNLNITWQYTVNGGATWVRCAPPGTPAIAAAGTSWHKIYLTWSVPLTWPLFETEVAVGSINGAGQVLPGVLLNRIWTEFRNQRAIRVDGTPMTYYNNWNVPTLGGVPDLLRFADGRCGQWAQFFIGCLQAQGMAPFNMRPTGVYTVPNLRGAGGAPLCRPTFMPFMVANWNFGVAGIEQPNYPGGIVALPTRIPDAGFPFENIMVLNPFDTFTPQCANILPPFGRWGYQWLVPPQVDYVGGNGANKGQNNPTPRSLFTDHAIVNYAGLFFDPSYGTIYQNNQDMQNQAINGICYPTWEQDLWDQSGVGLGPFVPLPMYPVLHIHQIQMGDRPLVYFCNF
jgi:VCBS repeat-containing protein